MAKDFVCRKCEYVQQFQKPRFELSREEVLRYQSDPDLVRQDWEKLQLHHQAIHLCIRSEFRPGHKESVDKYLAGDPIDRAPVFKKGKERFVREKR